MTRVLCLVPVLVLACSEEPAFRGDLPPVEAGEPLGLRNPTQTDIIAQVQPPMADVLWVIDNSCSMSCIVGCHTGGSVTDLVTQNFSSFMKHFEGSGVDYHIGVVTTDLDKPAEDGKLQPGLGNLWIDPATTNPVLVFDAMAVKGTGTDGSGQERGLGAAYKAVEEFGDTHNKGFFRDRSDLHSIVLSNEDDTTPADLITPAEFSDWYGNLRTPDKRTFNSIVCLDGSDTSCASRSGSFPGGANYIGVTQLVGGIVWDITDPNWSRVLDTLGARAAGLESEYFLTQVPVDGTLEVAVTEPNGNYVRFDPLPFETTEQGYAYTTTRNSVLFLNYLPAPGSTVELTYDLASASYSEER